MKGENPYTLTFGKTPEQLILRPRAEREVVDTFCAPRPAQQTYVITGVRGSGKTVLLSRLSAIFQEKPEWIVVELNSNRDLLTSLASKLSSENALAELFRRAKINLSFFGFGLEVSGEAPITDIDTALEKMLASIKSQSKRVLVAIDEVSNTQSMREFSTSFAMFARHDLPIFLLATGLYENVQDLQNVDNLTFLYRAPKIDLGPLNLQAIADSYQDTFGCSRKEAVAMTEATKGYSFAFQLLGYLTWNADGDWKSVLSEYRLYLDEYVYSKLWSELSAKDREVVRAIADTTGGRVQEIREKLGMESNEFSPYRQRLLTKGIVVSEGYGRLQFALPYFADFVQTQSW